MYAAATSFNESTESIEQEQEQEPDSPTETDLSVVNDVQAETEDGTADDDDASVTPKPVLDRWLIHIFCCGVQCTDIPLDRRY